MRRPSPGSGGRARRAGSGGTLPIGFQPDPWSLTTQDAAHSAHPPATPSVRRPPSLLDTTGGVRAAAPAQSPRKGVEPVVCDSIGVNPIRSRVDAMTPAGTVLATARFTLTPLAETDRHDLFAHLADPETVEYMDIEPLSDLAGADA